jgi:hypothetical protein
MIPFTAIFDIGSKLIDRLIPDKDQQAKAKLELLKLEQDSDFREAQLQISVMLAEAQSADKWTSRARPSFCYVIYLLLLSAIPMGIVSAISPATASDITAGFRGWLAAIPDTYLQLFGVVMLGYIGGRSVEKIKGVAK